MSRVKSKNSKIETSFCKELWKHGFRYRKNSSKYFGKPDIVLPKLKTVIFIDSCFWHGCKKHCRIPSTHKDYWIQKVARNMKRDKEVLQYYNKKQAWKIFRVWEHDLNKNQSKAIAKIIALLSERQNHFEIPPSHINSNKQVKTSQNANMKAF